MYAFVRRGVAVALLGLWVQTLTGCSSTVLHVLIPDFESASVKGVQVWRLDDATGTPVKHGRMLFGAKRYVNGAEAVDYTIELPDGTRTTTLPATIHRSANNPDSVDLELFYIPTGAQGWHKVSTFNTAGSSPLSIAQTYF